MFELEDIFWVGTFRLKIFKYLEQYPGENLSS